jgi:hypothetical protein
MTTETFFLMLRRVAARWGWPLEMYSDSAKQFIKAGAEMNDLWKLLDQKEIQKRLDKRNCNWHLNAPKSPHRGGIFERLIGTVKRSLKKITGIRMMEMEEMSTLLIEVASLVNSRPLAAMNNNIDDMSPITPNQLILGYDPIFVPEEALEEDEHASDLVVIKKRWRLRVEQRKAFYKCWMRDYLMTLSLQSCFIDSDKQLNQGELVLITKENTPRGQWPLGRVLSLITGADGLIRTVKLRVGRDKNGHRKPDITRPVQQLVRLECVDEEVSSVTKTKCPGEGVVPAVPSEVYRRKLRHRPSRPA